MVDKFSESRLMDDVLLILSINIINSTNSMGEHTGSN